MGSEKNLRQILMKLRNDKLIEEKVLLTHLEKFERMTKQTAPKPLPPLLAVLQTLEQNQLLMELNTKLEEIESKIETVISSWERKKLSASRSNFFLISRMRSENRTQEIFIKR